MYKSDRMLNLMPLRSTYTGRGLFVGAYLDHLQLPALLNEFWLNGYLSMAGGARESKGSGSLSANEVGEW